MDRLPIEVLHNVFIQLELGDRIVCTFVCRNWWRVLDEFSLLYSVCFVDEKDLLVSFLEMIDQFPHRATQVEELDVTNCIQTDFNKRTLLNTFPNLRLLKMEYDGPEPNAQNYFSEPIHINQSVSKLKILGDSIHCEVASQVLSSNLGGKLEEFELDFQAIRSISTRTLLDQLNNLPVLKRLLLDWVDIGVNDLENIHQNIPSIQELRVQDITIVDSQMPVNIIPATSLTTLDISIQIAASTTSHIQFYQYMTSKYSNVDNINCIDYSLFGNNDDDRIHIYLNGRLDFYKMIAAKKRTFFITCVPLGVNIFDVFDQAHCQLEKIRISQCHSEILQFLSQSKQSQYIQKLKINNTYLSAIHCVKSMPVLTSLELWYSRYITPPTINLADCLNACPSTLKEFSLSCGSITLDIFNIHLNNIETLDLSCEIIDRDLADVISTSFPKLVNLTLNGEIKESICIALANISFQKADFTLSVRNPYGVTFKAPNQTLPQHYIIDKADFHLVEYEKIRHLPVLTVSSFTEKRLDFEHDASLPSTNIRILNAE